ncbi:DUF4279 domain-containing protein [Bradyrhizobium sp. B124]|uniref:DUF4279 domain-containing protein n=1 Tax=Bradyrhizobium sp. B124 TaxID=3140245 RepID=UPI003183C203
MTEDEADDMQHMLRYTVRILIKHPSIDPARITSVLGLEPRYTAIAGGVRKTPTGIILSGVHKVSGWGHSYDVEGKRPFFSDVGEVLDKLESNKAFLAEISDGGGTIELIIHLSGEMNIGDTLSWQDMARLSALHVNLGIEVFPNS